MSALAEFLLARIAEDEALLEREDRVYGGDGEVWTIQAKTRARAECEAKRRIVDMAVTSSPPSPLVTKGATAVLRCLALPYADHPDYPETRETAPPTSKGERG